MRPGLKKEILRSNTNYRVARHIIDGLFLAEVVVSALGLFFWLLVMMGRIQQAEKLGAATGLSTLWLGVLVVCGVIVIGAAVCLKRELLHAIFDIADAQLERTASNPFKREGRGSVSRLRHLIASYPRRFPRLYANIARDVWI